MSTLLNTTIAAHLRHHNPLAAISTFTTSPSSLRTTTTYNLLLSAYTSLNQLPRALHLFDQMPTHDPVSYNTLISALAPRPAFQLFLRMLRSNVPPTGPTLSSILSSLPDSNLAPQVHLIAFRSALNTNPFVGSALITAYANLKYYNSIHQSFTDIKFKNPVTWTCLIIGLMDLNRVSEAHTAFNQMPSKTTTAYTALLTGYIKIRDIKSAKELFDDPTPEKNVVTWTAMISAYNKIGRFGESLNLFVQMLRCAANVRANHFTYSAALTCAAGLGSVSIGASIHARILKHSPRSDPALLTSLIEMYGKCGEADEAERAFDESGPDTRTLAMYNALIGSFGRNGRSDKAVRVFYRILEDDVGNIGDETLIPDGATFVNVLTACAHGGLVEEGERVWGVMERLGVKRGVEHWGCLTDMYGRAGKEEEASRVVEEMGERGDEVVEVAAGMGWERRVRELGERGEWGKVGEMKEERERRGWWTRKGRGGVSWMVM